MDSIQTEARNSILGLDRVNAQSCLRDYDLAHCFSALVPRLVLLLLVLVLVGAAKYGGATGENDCFGRQDYEDDDAPKTGCC